MAMNEDNNIGKENWGSDDLPQSNNNKNKDHFFDDNLDSLLNEMDNNDSTEGGHVESSISGKIREEEDIESTLHDQLKSPNNGDISPLDDSNDDNIDDKKELNPFLDGFTPDEKEIDGAKNLFDRDDPLSGLGGGTYDNSPFSKNDPLSESSLQDYMGNGNKKGNNPLNSSLNPKENKKGNVERHKIPEGKDRDRRNPKDGTQDKGKKSDNPLKSLGSGVTGAPALKNQGKDNGQDNSGDPNGGNGKQPSTAGKVEPTSNDQEQDKTNPLEGMGGGPEGSTGHVDSSERVNDSDDSEDNPEDDNNEQPKKPENPASKAISKNPTTAVVTGAGGFIALFLIMVVFMMSSFMGGGGTGAGSKGYSIGDEEEKCVGTGKESQGTDGKAGVPKGKKSNPEKMPPAVLTSPFGIRDGVPHKGQDIATAETGQKVPIYAWYEGTVVQSGPASGFGNWIVIEHKDKGKTLSTVYGHMRAEDLLVKKGDTVKSGQKISYQGNEGESRGFHVHFEVHTGPWSPDNAVDPKPYLKDAVNPGEGDSKDDKDDKGSEDKKKDDSSKDAKESGDIVTVKPIADSSESKDSGKDKGGDRSKAKRDDSNNTETIGDSTIQGVKQLKKDAYQTARSVLDEFPEVKSIGGWREDPNYPEEHPSGRAIDIMIPDFETSSGKKLGDRIHKYLWDNKDEFGIKYVLFRQHEYDNGPDKGTLMDDRGSPNENHFNHLHVATKSNEKQDGYKGGPDAEGSNDSGDSSCCAKTATDPSSNFTDSGNKVDNNQAVDKMIQRIIAVGKHLKMDDKAIEIALIVAEDESGFKNYANDGTGAGQSGASPVSPQEVAESLKYPHDAVGHDGNSVGPFQQQVGYWGDVPDLMRPGFQAGQFYAALKGVDYKNMAPEVAATKVQGNLAGASVYAQFVESGKKNYAKYKNDAKASEQDLKDGKRGFENRSKVTNGSGGSSSGKGDADSGSDQSSSEDSNAECSSSNDSGSSDGSDVVLIGDSLSVRAENEIKDKLPGVKIDAKVGRQFSEGLQILEKDKPKAKTVIMALGTNGTFSQEDIDKAKKAAGKAKLVLMTVGGPKVPSSGSVNKLVESNSSDVGVADWAKEVKEHPDYISEDGIHQSPSGTKAFADVIAKSVS